ncbi:hypothetical protein KEM52_004616 [Ascosphaera acerosa]|nr:hypothetical protein KEM52_004616 [Ascosphaera acerosa]
MGASTEPSTPRKRVPASEDGGSPSKRSKIPTCIEEASAEDLMLVRMKEEGRPIAEIRQAWEQMTGAKPGGSTLQVRYMRLKANLTVWAEEDIKRLLDAAKVVEAEWEKEKWARMAKALVEAGGATHDAAAVQKKYKELVKQGAA